MRHEKEIEEILELMLQKMERPWMNEEDKKNLKKELFAAIDLEEMDRQIRIGIKNGYSLEKQMLIIKGLINILNK